MSLIFILSSVVYSRIYYRSRIDIENLWKTFKIDQKKSWPQAIQLPYPTWAYSMIYGAELFHYNNTHTQLNFSVSDLYNNLSSYMYQEMLNYETSETPYECLTGYDSNEYHPKCVAYFINKTRYKFTNTTANVSITLKTYKVLDGTINSRSDVLGSIDMFHMLLNGIFYNSAFAIFDESREVMEDLENSGGSINDLLINTTCLVVGMSYQSDNNNPNDWDRERIMSTIYHPYVYNDFYYTSKIQDVVEFARDSGVMEPFARQTFHNKSVGLIFKYVVDGEEEESVESEVPECDVGAIYVNETRYSGEVVKLNKTDIVDKIVYSSNITNITIYVDRLREYQECNCTHEESSVNNTDECNESIIYVDRIVYVNETTTNETECNSSIIYVDRIVYVNETTTNGTNCTHENSQGGSSLSNNTNTASIVLGIFVGILAVAVIVLSVLLAKNMNHDGESKVEP